MIPLYKVHMPADVMDEVGRILSSGQLAFGKYSMLFEQKLKEYLGNPFVITTSTNNFALQIAFDLAGVGPGDEVIASPMSCLASNQPVLTNRGTVVWADIDPRTGTLDPDDVRKKITNKTKAILHYHWCGYPGNIEGINEIGKQHGITIVEDATEAFGAEYEGKKIGNTGSDIVCFSFQTVRLPNTIDGGAITFHSKEMFDKACLMRDYGIERKKFRNEMNEISSKCDIPIRGYNAMMNEVNGYIGHRQMEFVGQLLRRQAWNADAYQHVLSSIKSIEFVTPFGKAKPSYWTYTVLSNDSEQLMKTLRGKEIYTSRVHCRNDVYSCFGTGIRKELVGVASFAEQELCIPSGWWITDSERGMIVDALRQNN